MTDIVDRIDATLAANEAAKRLEPGTWYRLEWRPEQAAGEAERQFAQRAAEKAVLREMNKPQPDAGRIRRLIRAAARWFR